MEDLDFTLRELIAIEVAIENEIDNRRRTIASYRGIELSKFTA